MTNIKPSEVSKILKQQLEGVSTAIDVEEVGTVLQVGDGIAHIYGLRNVGSNSPPHTGRIRLLAEMFPQAKFIHLVRDPYSLFPSTWPAAGMRWNRCKDSRCPGTNIWMTTSSLPLNACTVVSISSALSSMIRRHPARSATKTSSRIRWANFAVFISSSISAT